MCNSFPTILGIDPGARQIGISIIRDKNLCFYAIKSFKKQSLEETLSNLRRIVGKLIREYHIEIVALERIGFVQQNSSFVKTIYQETADFVRKENVRLFEYHPQSIRRRLCEAEKPTKRNAALILSHQYAELARYYNLTKRWQKRYYALLFDSVAVAFVCVEDIEEINERQILRERSAQFLNEKNKQPVR